MVQYYYETFSQFSIFDDNKSHNLNETDQSTIVEILVDKF